jgi:hypothetical protein
VPRKVGYTHKLKAKSLVEFCPFCQQKIDGGGHSCPEATAAKASARLPKPKYCPLCGNIIEPGGHECPS